MTATHEQHVLGSMLLSRAAIDDAAGILDASDFADLRHGAIFDAITHLDGPVGPLPVHDAMTAAKVASDLAYLHSLVALVVSPTSAGYHAQQVKADSTRRRVKAAGERIAGMIETEDPLDAVNAARSILDDAVDDSGEIVANEVAVYQAIDSLDAPLGVKTPWRSLDDVISGWSPGMLYVVGARPGVGKTVLGVGVLLDVARRGQTAVMVSLEMPRNELYLRMLSNVGSVRGERILHRSTRGDDDDRLAQAASHVAALPLIVDDRSALSLAQVRSLVRGVQRTRDVGVVVVDYLGLVKPPADAPKNDRRVQVDAIAQGLKNLARDLGVPIVALAQLNRGIDGRGEKVPTLSDLRESGGIEAAADCVVLLHRDFNDAPDDLTVVVAKNRHGPQARFHLDFRGEFSRIEDPIRSALGASA